MYMSDFNLNLQKIIKTMIIYHENESKSMSEKIMFYKF